MQVTSRIVWGPIFSGTLVALALFLILSSFSAAVSVSFGGGGIAETTAWAFLLSIVSMYVAGWSMSRLIRGESRSEAAFYGLLLWALSAVSLLILAINGISIIGSETILGQSLTTLWPLTATAAWLAFGGASLSLLATVAGAAMGVRSTLSVGEEEKSRAKRDASLRSA